MEPVTSKIWNLFDLGKEVYNTSFKVLHKSVTNTKGLKKLLKLTVKIGTTAHSVFGQAAAYPFTILALASLKNCKANLGAVEIITRISEWICPDKDKGVPFWVTATTSGIASRFFRTVANACVTIKYFNTVDLLSLADWTQSIGRIPFVGRLTQITFLDIGFIKNTFKLVAAIFDALDCTDQLSKLARKEVKYVNKKETLELQVRNLQEIIEAQNRNANFSSSSTDLTPYDLKQRLKGFHVHRVMALTELRYRHSLPPQLTKLPPPTETKALPSMGHGKKKLLASTDIREICEALERSINEPSQAPLTVSITPGNPDITSGNPQKTQAELVEDFEEAMEQLKKRALEYSQMAKINPTEVQEIDALAKRVEQTADKHLASLSASHQLSDSFVDHLKEKKIHQSLERHHKAQSIADHDDLEQLKKFYQSDLERIQAKIDNLPAVRSILKASIIDDCGTILLSSAEIGLAIAGITPGFGLTILQLAQAALEFSCFAYESLNTSKKLPPRFELNDPTDTPTPR